MPQHVYSSKTCVWLIRINSHYGTVRLECWPVCRPTKAQHPKPIWFHLDLCSSTYQFSLIFQSKISTFFVPICHQIPWFIILLRPKDTFFPFKKTNLGHPKTVSRATNWSRGATMESASQDMANSTIAAGRQFLSGRDHVAFTQHLHHPQVTMVTMVWWDFKHPQHGCHNGIGSFASSPGLHGTSINEFDKNAGVPGVPGCSFQVSPSSSNFIWWCLEIMAIWFWWFFVPSKSSNRWDSRIKDWANGWHRLH